MMTAKSLFAQYFADRGIQLETVEANKIRLASRDEVAKAVGELLPAVCWDYGEGYQRYRFLGDPELFPRDNKGKPIKCKARKGSGNRLYQPRRAGQSPEALAATRLDPAVPVSIVEGEADTLGVLQAEEGSLVVGISGCFGWKSKADPILPDLRQLALPGRLIILCPDSDWAHNRNVFNGWAKLGIVLKQLGCDVQVTVIESEADDKLGAGDFIVRHGIDAWSDLERIPLADWQERGHELHKQRQQNLEDPNQEPRKKKESIAELLIRLGLELGSLWHDSSGAGWVDFVLDGALQTAKIRSKRFRDFLARILWEREGRSINSEAWTQTVGTLEGLARFDYPEREAFLRVGQHEGSIYIDLGSPDWSIVEVTATGWQIIPYADCPIRFYRADCQLPLPTPEHGGSISDLWQILNFKQEDRPLVLGWILSCLVPDGAKPILALSGEKGSGKSSAATLLKRLTDPTKVSKASAVGDERRMAAMAAGRWVLSFDNLTYLSAEQQDLLCCVSTGAGFSHRTLYTDLEETFLEYRRPQILTGVDLVPTRSDLLDRSLIVRLERIPEEDRLPEADLEHLTIRLLPGIYGALLDLLATALRQMPTTRPAKLPRMADFAKLCIAAGIPGFMEAYATNIQAGCQAAIEANPVAAGILSLLESTGGSWMGTATELAKKLQEGDPSNRDFQRLSGESLGKKLARSLKTDLEAVGVSVDHLREGRKRTIILTLAGEKKAPSQIAREPSQPSQLTQPSQDKGFSGDGSKTQPSQNRHQPSQPPKGIPTCDSSIPSCDSSENKPSPPKPSQGKDSDSCDSCDGFSAAYSAAKNGNSLEPVELDESELVELSDEEEEEWLKSLRR